jgi:hypothetical protein
MARNAARELQTRHCQLPYLCLIGVYEIEIKNHLNTEVLRSLHQYSHLRSFGPLLEVEILGLPGVDMLKIKYDDNLTHLRRSLYLGFC